MRGGGESAHEGERDVRLLEKAADFGDHLQYSVFRCDLTDTRRAVMIATIDPLLDHDDDQVLIIDLGPVDGRAATCIFSLGKAYQNPERRVIII